MELKGEILPANISKPEKYTERKKPAICKQKGGLIQASCEVLGQCKPRGPQRCRVRGRRQTGRFLLSSPEFYLLIQHQTAGGEKTLKHVLICQILITTIKFQSKFFLLVLPKYKKSECGLGD